MSLELPDPSALINALADKAEDEFESRGEGWLDELLVEGRELVDTELDGELKDEFDANTPDQAQKVLAKEIAAEARLAKETVTGLEKLEEQYGWGEDSTVPGSTTRTLQDRRNRHGH